MTKESAPRRTRTWTRTPTRSRVAALAVASGLGLVLPWLPAGTATAATPTASPSPSVSPSTPTPTSVRYASRVLDLPAGFRPEGITASGNTLYVSSLADGQVLAVDGRTGARKVLLPGASGRALRGLQVDGRTGLLYVTGNEGTTGVVYALDRRSGRVAHRWEVAGAQFLNDLVVTPRAVWVTDSRVDRLARVALDGHGRPSSAAPSVLPLRGPWPVPNPAGIRANGIRALGDGTLLLDHSTAGGLWAVSPGDGTVRKVPVTGGPAIIGGDGLERAGNRLWIVRGTGQTSVTELRLDVRGGEVSARWVRDLTDPSLDVPSTTVLAGGRLWTVNARFGVPDPATASFWITGLPVHRTGPRF